ncbi:MAG: L,D-transpeptidase, partial [Eubacteriales bacterium]
PGASSYWTLPMDITDEEAVWNMLMEPITVVDIGKKKGLSYSQLTKQNIYMYLEPDEDSKIVGEITNLSQGVRVIEDLGNGWTHVECYSSSFFSKPATKIKAWNILVSGYVKSKYLRQVQPTDKLALVIDKLSQHLYVFQEGKMIAELLCSTGLVQWNGKKYQPYNETRSGEFLLINMTGSLDSDRLKCSYAIRFNAGDEIHEVPHLVRADGTFEYKTTEPYLGQKRSHGCIRIQRLATPEGINMAWIYKRVRDLDLCGKVKIVIWEDWQGRQLPVPDPDTVLYYNDNGKGQYYHRGEKCNSASSVTFSPFRYAQLDEAPYSKLKACPWCNPVRRESDIEEINQRYAPGGDHDELLTELRQDYYDYLEKD